MMKSQTEEKRAVEAGYWPLYRYNPMLAKEGKSPFIWETKDATADYKEFIKSEGRYKALLKTAPKEADALFELAAQDAKRRMEFFKKLGGVM